MPGATWDARGDQYSFCASFWEALHGDEALAPSPEPAPGRGRIPRALRRALRRGMAREPEPPTDGRRRPDS